MTMNHGSSSLANELSGVQYPRKQDVLLGRGGHATSFPGNVKFRLLIDQHKARYMAASKPERVKIADEIVGVWRSQDPPGRFLTRTEPEKGEASLWHDIGDKAASKKVHNSLRQQIPTNDFLAAMRRQDSSTPAAASTLAQPDRSQQSSQIHYFPFQDPFQCQIPAIEQTQYPFQWQPRTDFQEHWHASSQQSQPSFQESQRYQQVGQQRQQLEQYFSQQWEQLQDQGLFQNVLPQHPQRVSHHWQQRPPSLPCEVEGQNEDQLQVTLNFMQYAPQSPEQLSGDTPVGSLMDDPTVMGRSIPTAAHLTMNIFATDDEHDNEDSS